MKNTYLFKTETTMKEYNRSKYWIDRDYIAKDIYIKADNVDSALCQYVEQINNDYGDIISKNAVKTRQAMYIDTKEGETKQVGYVLTASIDFDNDHYKWTKQFVDLWITINRIEEAF